MKQLIFSLTLSRLSSYNYGLFMKFHIWASQETKREGFACAPNRRAVDTNRNDSVLPGPRRILKKKSSDTLNPCKTLV